MPAAKKELPLIQPDEQKRMIHVHGWNGAGKTWMAAGSPGPVFYADVERGVYDTPQPKVRWDDVKDDLSVLKGHKDLVVVYPLETEKQLQGIVEMFLAGKWEGKQHPFETLTVDSLNMFQMKLKREVQNPGKAFDPDTKIDWDGWNRLLNHMLMLVEDMRRVADPNHTRPANVVLLTATDRDQLYARPMLEGNFRKRLPGIVDLHGFLRTHEVDGQANVPVLHLHSTDTVDAKCRLDGVAKKWPEGRIVRPTVPDILAAANNQ